MLAKAALKLRISRRKTLQNPVEIGEGRVWHEGRESHCAGKGRSRRESMWSVDFIGHQLLGWAATNARAEARSMFSANASSTRSSRPRGGLHPTGRLSAVAAELLDGQNRHQLVQAWPRGEG
jgi:hypothetical protein